MPLESRWSLLIFRSHGRRSRSNGQSVDCQSVVDHVLSAQYLLIHLLDINQTSEVALRRVDEVVKGQVVSL